MFDVLLKGKFYCKCKSDMKMMKNRIEMIKKKRNAMQKYLRNDVTDLLRNELDINAYGRADGLCAELNRTECYEFIDQCVANVLNHLGVMNKEGECPEESREAVSSLMFAAARFADLPELRELRTMFSEKYGSSLDIYVNKQFVEKLKSGPPSKDKKLQLLQDIAHESGIEWNSKALEKKLYNDATGKEQDSVKETNGSTKENDSSRAKYQFKNARELTVPEKKHFYYRNKESPSIEERFSKGSHTVLPVKEIQVIKKAEPKAPRGNPKKEAQEDQSQKYSSIPPPYTVSEVNKPKNSIPPLYTVSREKTPGPLDSTDSDVKSKPILKSVRTRNFRPPLTHDTANRDQQEKMADKNKETVAQGQRILKFFDGGGRNHRDDEEIMMDKILRRLSRKKDPNENIKPSPLLNAPAADHAHLDLNKVIKSRSKDGPKPSPLLNAPAADHARLDLNKVIKSRSKDGPNRSSSLPGELNNPTETPKGHTRTASFQPEMMNGNNLHVHPKMPDYDDFLARLASLRQKS